MIHLQEKILGADFDRITKRFVLIVFCTVLVLGTSSGYVLREQISQAVFYLQSKGTPQSVGGTLTEQGEEEREADEKAFRTQEWKSFAAETKHQREERHGKHDLKNFLKRARITRPSFAAKIVLTASAGICVLLFAMYWLLVVAWLYKAASAAGLNPILWSLLGMSGNIIAAVAFLLWRSRKTHCPACGSWQDGDIKKMFCHFCGKTLWKNCPKCGAILSLKDRFCPECGEPVEESQKTESGNESQP